MSRSGLTVGDMYVVMQNIHAYIYIYIYINSYRFSKYGITSSHVSGSI